MASQWLKFDIQLFCSMLPILITLASFCLAAQSLEDSPKSLLDGRSFSLRSSVTYVLGETSSLKCKSLETYSHEQRRAKIEYALQASYNAGSNVMDLRSGAFYLDKSGHLTRRGAFKIDKDNRKCQKSTVAELVKQTLLADALGDIMDEREEDDGKIAPSHVVGPGRLLYLITRYQHKLELVEAAGSGNKTVRNIPCSLYKFEHHHAQGGSSKFLVFLSKELAATGSSARNKQLWPIRVTFDVGKAESYIIDYSSLEFLDPSQPGDNYEQLHESGGDLGLDKLTVPPVSGCFAAQLSGSGSGSEAGIHLFANRSETSDKFSFTADIDYNLLNSKKQPIWLKTFVAFDGRLDSMFYDLRGVSGAPGPSPQSSGVRKLIYNFKTNRVYHLVERAAKTSAERNFLDKVLDLSQELNLDESGRTASSQCAVAQIVPGELLAEANLAKGERFFSLGQLLVGSDRFVYLGRALVRGIRALVYESTIGPELQVALPFWLETPMFYVRRDTERPEAYKSVILQEGRLFNTVVYMADSEAPEQQVPLMMEIYIIDKERSLDEDVKRAQRHTIYFYDFAWELDQLPPNGQLPGELFSLQDRCSSDTSGGRNSQHARVDLLLELTTADSQHLEPAKRALQVARFRNLALQASLHETYELPASMIFALESKFLENNNLIAASFQLAEHYQQLAQVVFLGVGDFYGAYQGPLEVVRVRSLQACFFHAAHIRGARILFAYNERARECYIDLAPFDSTANIFGPEVKLSLPSFYLYPRQNYDNPRAMSVFMSVYEREDSIGRKSSSWLQELTNLRSKINMLNSELIIRDVALNENIPFKGTVKLKVRKLSLIDATQQANNNSPNGSQLVEFVGERLQGFGLLEADSGLNRLLDPAQLDSQSWRKAARAGATSGVSAMSLDQCKAACLADLECQSYSVCLIKGQQLECILSRVNFRDCRYLRQLNELLQPNSEFSSKKTLRIQLEAGKTVQLVKRQSCEIVNKDYLALYRKPEPTKVLFTNRQVIPVASSQLCAQLCTRLNIRFMGAERAPQDESASPASGAGSGFHQLAGRQVCKAFLYTDRVAISGELQKRMAENVLAGFTPEEVGKAEEENGYCILGETAGPEEAERMRKLLESRSGAADSEINSVTTLNIFYFRYEHFYQKQSGVRLLGSEMTQTEEAAFNVVREILRQEAAGNSLIREKETYKEAIKLMENFVASGNNIQVRLSADESKCAKYCFLQLFTGWPSCKSFDIVVERLPALNQQVVMCYLNSLTINEAIALNKLNLIEEAPAGGKEDTSGHRWHFETLSGLPADQAKREGWLAGELLRGLAGQFAGRTSFRIHALGATFLALLGLAAGVILGLKLAPGLLARIKTDDTTSLVEGRRPFTVNFVNQVNSEGAIPEMVA